MDKFRHVQYFPPVGHSVRSGEQSADDPQSPKLIVTEHVFDDEKRRNQVHDHAQAWRV